MSEPIWSTGGAGGNHAVIEDLLWAASALLDAALDVETAQLEIARRSAALELSPNVGHAALAHALRHLNRTAARNAIDDIEDTAKRVGRVAIAYLHAERQARRSVGFGERVVEAAEDAVGTHAWVARVAGAGALATTGLGLGLIATGHGELIAKTLPNDAPPTTGTLTRDSVEAALNTPFYELIVASLNLITTSPILEWLKTTDLKLSATPADAAPVRSLEDVMRRLLDTQQAPGGAVRIQRWTGADGVTRRIVFIPGTEDWLNASSNPFDSKADLEVMAGQMPDAALLVAEALAADGAEPGDPVMLAGHSLGGMVATALAANPAFVRRFNIRALVTAGSPVGRITLPTSVNALHLEGTRDVVPGLDGAPNPDTPTRVTVHHDARRSEVPALDGAAHGIGSAHHLNTYAQTARLADQGFDASTEAWLSAEKDFLAPSAEMTVTEYRP